MPPWQGQHLRTGPYTTKALPANITNLVLPLGGVGGGLKVMLKYQIYKSMLKDSPSYGKFYARIVSEGTYGVAELAQHMADHNTPYSVGTIKGILADAVVCIQHLLLDGKRLTLDGLVSLGISITHKMGAASADEFSVAKNVEKVRLVATGIGDFASSALSAKVKLKESNSYQSPRNASGTTTPPDDGGGEVIDPGNGDGTDTENPSGGGSGTEDTGGGSSNQPDFE